MPFKVAALKSVFKLTFMHSIDTIAVNGSTSLKQYLLVISLSLSLSL